MINRACRGLLIRGAIVAGLVLPTAGYAQVLELKPNLTALQASELSVVLDSVTGEPILRFATTSWNSGTGPTELVAGGTGEAGQDIYQRIYLSDGGYYDRLAGTFVYHETHNHFHFEGYANYTLQPVNAPGASQRQSSKTSFCLMDTTKIDGSLPGAPAVPVYSTCNDVRQGISVGWGDRYGPTLAGQSFDLGGNPSGDYDLIIEIDPENRILESNEADNVSCLRVHISVSSLTAQALGSCSSPTGVTLASVTPSSVYAGSSVTVTIRGTGFAAGMAVGFENGSGPAPIATNVVVVDPNTITATVTVKSGGGRRERFWDVRVSSAVLPRGLRIMP